MPRFSVSICPDCASTLGAGSAVTIQPQQEGLTCVHQTAVDLSTDVSKVAALITVISIRPQSMQPEIRSVRLTQDDLDAITRERGLSPASWAAAAMAVDLEALANESRRPVVSDDDECECGHTRAVHYEGDEDCKIYGCYCQNFRHSDLDMASGQEML